WVLSRQHVPLEPARDMDDEDALGVVEDPVDLGICNGAGFLEMRLLYGVYDPCRQGGAILVNIGHRGVAHLEARALGGDDDHDREAVYDQGHQHKVVAEADELLEPEPVDVPDLSFHVTAPASSINRPSGPVRRCSTR